MTAINQHAALLLTMKSILSIFSGVFLESVFAKRFFIDLSLLQTAHQGIESVTSFVQRVAKCFVLH